MPFVLFRGCFSLHLQFVHAAAGEHELANLEFAATEIDEQSVLYARGPEIAEYLSDMFIGQRLACFDLDNQSAFDK